MTLRASVIGTKWLGEIVMVATSVLGSSPVNVLTKEGKQFGIPLSILSINNNVVGASKLGDAIGKENANFNLALGAAEPVLKALLHSGAITEGEAPAPVRALTLKAKTSGAAGNSISISFANVVPDAATPANSVADVRVTYQDRRKGLTVASIGTELGTPSGGAAPGLLALTAAATKLPAVMEAKALDGKPLRLKVPAKDGSGTAFTLEAAGIDPLLAYVTAAVEDVDEGAGTFTLTIALDHLESGVTLHDLVENEKFGLLLDILPGPDGFAAPAEGTTTLTGGADQQSSAPKAAEAVVLSG